MNKEMKQYTGTKTVKAMPMTMGEAYERKLLKEGVIPSEKDYKSLWQTKLTLRSIYSV